MKYKTKEIIDIVIIAFKLIWNIIKVFALMIWFLPKLFRADKKTFDRVINYLYEYLTFHIIDD